MAARRVTIFVTMLISIITNISDELILPNPQRNTNPHQILNDLHKDDMKLMRVKDDIREYNIGIAKDEEHNINLQLNSISNRLQNNEHIEMYIDDENGDNIKLNPISKSHKETFEINAKNKPSIASINNILLEDGVKIIKEFFNIDKDIIKADNTKTLDFNTFERVKRDSEDDDIIIWDYCEGKAHLEYIDGRFECVEVSIGNRSNIGSLVNCPNDTRRVILNSRVVFCRPKKRRS